MDNESQWEEVLEIFHNNELIAMVPASKLWMNEIRLFGEGTQLVRDKHIKMEVKKREN